MNQIITLANFTRDKKCLGYCVHPYFFLFYGLPPGCDERSSLRGVNEVPFFYGCFERESI